MKKIHIGGQEIEPGTTREISFKVARLPTGIVIEMPVTISRGKADGKHLLLLGGMHGDEINGVEIIRRILSQQINRPESGLVICIPIINVFGFINFSREVTKGKDVNRSFPGSPRGSLASQTASTLMKEIIPHVDCGIDFHTGGRSINNYPQIRTVTSQRENLELARAFAAPFLLNARLRDKSLRKSADKLGIPVLVYEGGESLRLRKSAIDLGVQGTQRVMKHLGLIAEAPSPAPGEPIELTGSSWVRAGVSGVFFANVRNGAVVRKGEVLGMINDPYGAYEHKVKASHSGYVIGINNNPVVNRGDALIHVGINS